MRLKQGRGRGGTAIPTQDLLLVDLAQGLPLSTVVFGVAVTLPREPTCPGRDGISGCVGGSGSRRCSNIWRKGRAFLGAGICNRWPREVSEGVRQQPWCCGHWLVSVPLHPNTSGRWWDLWVAPRRVAAQTAPSVPACLPHPPPCHGEGTSSTG